MHAYSYTKPFFRGIMAKGLKVKVTKKHIEEGDQTNADSCAIALAIRDAVTTQYKRCSDPLNLINLDDLEVSVDTDKIEVQGHVMEPGVKIKKFIETFDEEELKDDDGNVTRESGRERVKPFEFNLKLS